MDQRAELASFSNSEEILQNPMNIVSSSEQSINQNSCSVARLLFLYHFL